MGEPLYQREFAKQYHPEPDLIKALESQGFKDESWHNDVCPKWCYTGEMSIVEIFVNAHAESGLGGLTTTVSICVCDLDSAYLYELSADYHAPEFTDLLGGLITIADNS